MKLLAIRKPILCLPLTAIGLSALPAIAVTFTNDTIIGISTNFDGADIVITNCTVTMDGVHAFASLQVLNGGKLTHSSNRSGMNVTLTNDLLVASGGAINASGKGYAGGAGPGAGGNIGFPLSGGGGGYGGHGGYSATNSPGGIAYGQILQPTDEGSGGGSG